MSTPDIRRSEVYRETLEHFEKWLEPGFGKPAGFSEVDVHPFEDRVVARADVLTELAGVATSRLFEATGDRGRFLTGPTGNARFPRFSPDGEKLAFLSDRAEKDVFQLYLLLPGLGEAVATSSAEGIVEYLAWSPDASRILLGVAGRGADAAGGAGSGTLAGDDGSDAPGWLPVVEGSQPSAEQWRSVWIHELASGKTTRASREGVNVWDAAWVGTDRLALVASEGDPREGAWYTADLRVTALDGSNEQVVHSPQRQFGVLAANPAGTRLAVVEAVGSDRGVMAGDLRLIDLTSGDTATTDSLGVDVGDVQWLDDDRVGWSGLRGFESVYGVTDVADSSVVERWVTTETSGTRYPEATWRADGSFACTLESYDRPVSLVVVRDGDVTEVASTRSPGTDYLATGAGSLEQVTWQARDGLEIGGLLALPDGDGPFPLVVLIHGGPIWAYRNRWTMGNDLTPLLVRHGYAVLHPNPRGSTGRGAAFAGLVVGDMGGEDTYDYLTGIDALVERGIVDPQRLGLTGGSYGGFMSAWLITQDARFKAAVPLSPVTDWYSQHHTSNIPSFDALFLDGRPRDADGLAWSRSPVMFADRVVTPTLQTAGAKDRSTPSSQALEFHAALVEAGVESQCVVYPEEGHGVRNLPARVDLATRVLDWFRQHMPA